MFLNEFHLPGRIRLESWQAAGLIATTLLAGFRLLALAPRRADLRHRVLHATAC